VGNAFDDTEVEEVKKFVAIGKPVGGMAARCNKSGSPIGMFGIVVASCYEPTPEGTIEGY
jgi:hypothetical protein